MELEKVKNIVYISCVAVFTLVATVCLTKFTLSASKMMNRFGTRFEEIENHVEKCSESLDKILSEYASDDPPKSGSKGDNLGKILKNVAEITQTANEKLVGNENKKGALENASEICERANNGLKSVHESHIITAKLDTRTDEEKSDEESRGGIIESDNVAFHAGADLKGEYNENSSLLDRFVSWVFCHPV